jgi:RNA recognition motif-containing protein
VFQDSYEEEPEEVTEKVEIDPNAKLFVGNLPFSVDSAQLAGIFGDAGEVEMVEVYIFFSNQLYVFPLLVVLIALYLRKAWQKSNLINLGFYE